MGWSKKKKLAEERSSDQSLLQSKKGEKEMGEKKEREYLKGLEEQGSEKRDFFLNKKPHVFVFLMFTVL